MYAPETRVLLIYVWFTVIAASLAEALGGTEVCGSWEYKTEVGNHCAKCRICDENTNYQHETCISNHPHPWKGQLVWCHSLGGGAIPMCPQLEPVQNGHFKCDDGNFLDSTCQLNCDEGYVLQGPRKYIMCNENTGEWTDFPPTCVRNSTETKNAFDGGVSIGLSVIVTAVVISVVALLLCMFHRRCEISNKSTCPLCGLNNPCSHNTKSNPPADYQHRTPENAPFIPRAKGSTVRSHEFLVTGEGENNGVETPNVAMREPEEHGDPDVSSHAQSLRKSLSLENILENRGSRDTYEPSNWTPVPSGGECVWHIGPGHAECVLEMGPIAIKGQRFAMSLRGHGINLAVWENKSTGWTQEGLRLDIPCTREAHAGWYRVVVCTEGNKQNFDKFMIKITVVDGAQPVEHAVSIGSSCTDDIASRALSLQGATAQLMGRECSHIGKTSYNITADSNLAKQQQYTRGAPVDRLNSEEDNTQYAGISLPDINLKTAKESEGQTSSKVLGNKVVDKKGGDPSDVTLAIDDAPLKPLDYLWQSIMNALFPEEDPTPETRIKVHEAITETGGSHMDSDEAVNQRQASPLTLVWHKRQAGSEYLPVNGTFPTQWQNCVSQPENITVLNSDGRKWGSSSRHCNGNDQGSAELRHCRRLLMDLVNNPDFTKDLSVVMESSQTTDTFGFRFAEMTADDLQYEREVHFGRESLTSRTLRFACNLHTFTVGTLVEFLEEKRVIKALRVVCYYHNSCPYCSKVYKRNNVEPKKTENVDPRKTRDHPGFQYHEKAKNCLETLRNALNKVDPASKRCLAKKIATTRGHVELLSFELGGLSRDYLDYIRQNYQCDIFTNVTQEIYSFYPDVKFGSLVTWLCAHSYKEEAVEMGIEHIRSCNCCRNIVNEAYTTIF